jgi:hypothetical protein
MSSPPKNPPPIEADIEVKVSVFIIIIIVLNHHTSGNMLLLRMYIICT